MPSMLEIFIKIIVSYISLMLVVFPKDVLENKEFNLNNDKVEEGLFRYKDQGFQIKLLWLLLLFQLIKHKSVVNF